MITLVGVLVYLAVGVGVALAARWEGWIETIRLYHIIFWLPLFAGWLATMIGFWMAG